ncbi:sodium:solute symporter [bacterium]|nr:sodium:solute symporter [bacterium]
MLDVSLNPWLSIVPPLIAIIIALRFRQVYAALFTGLWCGTTILAGGNPLKGLADVIELCIRVFGDPDNTRVILFSACIGAVIAFTQRSGGVQGFVEWLSRRSLITSRRRAQLMAMIIGSAVPIESSISILVTGTVSRPIFDRLKISREKLAYICDSISAPVCSLIPVNAWGAFMAGLLANQGIAQPLHVYFKAIIFNFYAIFAVLLMLFLILTRRDFFSMRRAEKRADEQGLVLREGATPLIADEVIRIEPKPGIRLKAINMIIPIAIMVTMMAAGLFITGRGDITQGSGSTAVLWAVLTAVVSGGILYRVQGIMKFPEMTSLFFKGVGGLIPIAVLMMFAFAIGRLCRDMGTGAYVAGVVKDVISPAFIPAIIFVTTSFIAFSTGTSWGTWGIMVPIGIPLAQSLGLSILPVTAAIVSGGVFGDHCSPISDTTLIASMASASDHIDHVNTQLPYALIAGAGATMLFLVTGFVMQ